MTLPYLPQSSQIFWLEIYQEACLVANWDGTVLFEVKRIDGQIYETCCLSDTVSIQYKTGSHDYALPPTRFQSAELLIGGTFVLAVQRNNCERIR